jgi:hypothetical protein
MDVDSILTKFKGGVGKLMIGASAGFILFPPLTYPYRYEVYKHLEQH